MEVCRFIDWIERYIELQENMYEFNKITRVIFGGNVGTPLNIYPQSLKHLELGYSYDKPLPDF